MSTPPKIIGMARTEYYHDLAAPQAQELLPAAFAVVRNSSGRILLVRRADDGYWELPGGRIEVGESASAAVIREVREEARVAIRVTGIVGVYSDPRHVLVYPREAAIYQQFAVCFHAISTASDAHHDDHGTTAAAWFEPEQATQLSMHPAMRQRLTDALTEPHQAHFD
jgi:ADP-ribose pyrophosphatase YjhB (NUDIX family)